jgi:hypothetical protein
MASLAAPLAFPLGGGGSSPLPSGSFQGVTPLGGQGSTVGGGGLYFNPNYPPNLSGLTYTTYLSSGTFIRWMPTPLISGSTVIDLVMPGGYNDSDQWYLVGYTFNGTGLV